MPPRSVPLVYLAGPDVFLADAAAVGDRKLRRCAAAGLAGRFPLEDPTDLGRRPVAEQAQLLFDACVAMMDDCEAGLVNLSPFRGPSADVGTAFELGYLFAQGKPVVGYTSDERHYNHRVDDRTSAVEQFGLADNLMLDRAAAAAGIEVVRRAAGDGEEPVAALAAFDVAVNHLASLLGSSG